MDDSTGPKIGSHVIVCDSTAKQHDALVTANWGYGKNDTPAINVVYVTDDESKTDSYGHQIERMTSVTHKSNQSAPGYWWDYA